MAEVEGSWYGAVVSDARLSDRVDASHAVLAVAGANAEPGRAFVVKSRVTRGEKGEALGFYPSQHCHMPRIRIEALVQGLGGAEMSSVLSGSVGKGGLNRGPDVRAVQCLLNLNTNMVQSGMTAKLVMSGSHDKAMQDAIDLYQRKVMNARNPDGRVDKHGGMIRRLVQALPPKPSGSYSDPPWLKIACDEEATGVSEKTGRPSNNPRILEYLTTAKHLAKIKDVITTKKPDGKKEEKETGYMLSEVDETAWCACFVNWCLAQAGKIPLKGARAEYYKDYGTESVVDGNICVIQREPFDDSSSGWHVGFCIGGDPQEGYVLLLGGNQDNSVCRKWFVGIEPRRIWRRWPT